MFGSESSVYFQYFLIIIIEKKKKGSSEKKMKQEKIDHNKLEKLNYSESSACFQKMSVITVGKRKLRNGIGKIYTHFIEMVE